MNSKKATIYNYARLCQKHTSYTGSCKECPLDGHKTGFSCIYLMRNEPDKANEIILNWCKEHPVETRQDRLLKIFPNAKIDNCGTLIFCPRWVDKDFKCNRERLSCAACEKEYWLAEVDE